MDQRTAQELVNRICGGPARIYKLAGGDINEVYRVVYGEEQQVIKINHAQRYPGMFAAEADGLKALDSTGSFRVPSVLAVGETEGAAYLLMEYIPTGTEKKGYWELFGRQLARMHRHSDATFGYHMDNYIGSLPQHNGREEDILGFYVRQRLEPQFAMARQKGYTLEPLETFYKNLESLIPKEIPALVHGDLWSGNYLTDDSGCPVLIDPAVAYGPREMDLAMMELFGGFPHEVFAVYDQSYKRAPGYEERRPLWQLYYLLVHLNLFGAGYLERVKHIVRRYS